METGRKKVEWLGRRYTRTNSKGDEGVRLGDFVVFVEEALGSELFGLAPVLVAHVHGEAVEDEEGVARDWLTGQLRRSVVAVTRHHGDCVCKY